MSFDPDRMRALFEEVPAPDGIDRWRVATPARGGGPRPRTAVLTAAGATLLVTSLTVGLISFGGTQKEVTVPPAIIEPSQVSPSPLAQSPVPSPTPSPATPPSTGSPTHSAPSPTRSVHSGDLRITTAGALISDLHVTGTIVVEAPNVTLRRVRVARERDGYWAVRQLSSARNLTIETSEIGGDGRHSVQHGIAQEADGLTVRDTVVRAVEMGITVLTRATVERTRIVDLLPSDSGFGLVCHGGGQITARDNTIIVPPQANAAIALFADRPISGVRISGNLLGGGRSTLHAGGPQEVEVTGNRFRRQSEPVRWDTSAPKVWSGNTWEDNGAPLSL
ncbi:MAG TPA: hypothetical protein VF062_14970 [Candidatus Limnocylindrales bacterium]